MRAYIDSSAFVKIFLTEIESAALRHFLDSQDDLFVLFSSVLLETESRRAAQVAAMPQAAVTLALSEVNLAEAPPPLFTQAGLLAGRALRSLDALHLSTAIRHGADLLIAYDQGLLEAATAHGIPTVSPG